MVPRAALRFDPGLTHRRGLVLIQSQIAQSVAAVDFTKGIDSRFDEYVFEASAVIPATDITSMYARFSVDGGANFLAANYSHQHCYTREGGAASSSGGSGAAQIIPVPANTGNGTGEFVSFVAFLHHPSSTSLYKIFHGNGAMSDNGTALTTFMFAGTYTGSAAAINGVRFLISSGNITGIFKMFGVKR